MILSNAEILTALDEGRLVIDPEPKPRKPPTVQGDPECPFQTSAVDLRLSNEVSIFKGEASPVVIDLTKGKFAKSWRL
jgi:deoxycytidine triphosphate deaminase